MYRSECLVVSVEKEGKGKFEVPDSSLVGCGTVATTKGDVPQGYIAYIFMNVFWKKYGILF
jgi:hypothetical protein